MGVAVPGAYCVITGRPLASARDGSGNVQNRVGFETRIIDDKGRIVVAANDMPIEDLMTIGLLGFGHDITENMIRFEQGIRGSVK